MDENRVERFKELVNQIEVAEDVKERIRESVIYRKRRKGTKVLKYAAAAAVIFICVFALNPGFYKNEPRQGELNVYASELDGDDWMVLPPGEKRQLSSSVETGWGYRFKLEVPEGDGYIYTRTTGTTIGIEWVYLYEDVIWWHVEDDSEWNFPEHMESDLVIYVGDSEGNRIGQWRLIVSREGDARFAELVDENEKIKK